ncbi:hypothetical protein CH252_19225 [Rhodococcus sp. 06-1477-1B]|nr:hypothetical protein CH252_19225 [Rhodococcus sp. 06-1477-1B]
MAMELKQILLRGDTSAAWIAANPILAAREMAIDTTEHRVKVGDGASAWTSLPWSSMAASEVTRLESAATALEGATSISDAAMTSIQADPSSAFAVAQKATIGAVVADAVAPPLAENPARPGTFTITDPTRLTANPARPGTFLIGAAA